MCFKYILKGLFSTIWWRQSYLSTCIQYYIYYSLLKWLRICGVSELKLQQNIKHCVEMKPNITTEKVLSETSAARLETSNLKKKHPCWGIISSSHLVAYCMTLIPQGFVQTHSLGNHWTTSSLVTLLQWSMWFFYLLSVLVQVWELLNTSFSTYLACQYNPYAPPLKFPLGILESFQT